MRKGGYSRFSWLKLLVSLLVVASLIGIGIIGYLAFTHQLLPIVGAISFIVIVGLFVWFITILRKSSMLYRTPSFILVFLSLVGITLICAFAGVEPLAAYKDNILNSISSRIQNVSNSIKANNPPEIPANIPLPVIQVAHATEFDASSICYNMGHCLYVGLKPNNGVVANTLYIVDLYEKGKFRESTTVQWNQPEANVLLEKRITFHISTEEYNAYFMKDISNIFSVRVHQ